MLQPRQSRIDAWVFAALVSVSLGGALLWSTAPPNHDTSWWLLLTDRVLSGYAYGRDIIELNPPLFLFATMPPVFVAERLSLDPYLLFCLWLGLIIAASAFASQLAVRRLGASWPTALLVGIGFVLIETFAVARDYGQREAVLTALVMPFALNEIARLVGAAEALRRRPIFVSAGAGAIGILLKPFFATLPAAIVVVRFLRERRIAPDYWFMLAIAAVYAAGVAVWAPHYIELLPLISASYASGYNDISATLHTLLRDAIIFALVGALIYANPGPLRRSALTLAAVSALFYLGAALQLKGFSYHFLPGRVTLGLALIVSVAGPVQGSILRQAPRWAGAALLVFVVARGFVGPGFLDRREMQRDELSRAVALAHGRPVLAISPLLQGIFPQVNELHATWGSRNGFQWMLLGAEKKLRASAPATRAEGLRLRRETVRMLLEDFQRWRPAVVVVARRAGRYSQNVDWLAFLRADPDFAAAFQRYCLEESSPSWDVFTDCPAHASARRDPA